MPECIQEELEKKVAAVLLDLNTDGEVNCVLIQAVPQNKLDEYVEIYGSPSKPFWSVSSVLPETLVERESFNQADSWVRPVTVALYAERATARSKINKYKWVRQQAIRALNKYRFTGTFESDNTACLRYGVVRPRSQIEAAAWARSSAFISAFDINFKTVERRGAEL